MYKKAKRVEKKKFPISKELWKQFEGLIFADVKDRYIVGKPLHNEHMNMMMIKL